MFEQFNTLRRVFDNSKECLARFVPQEQIDSLATEIEQRTATHKPVVMVYGVYNAGKSTLLNALMGEDLAETGEGPRTSVVTAYTFGDVQILDTPGIDAPDDHEQISREQLNKSDAVIFVLSSAGVLEEQQTYAQIGAILAAKKPLILVINNRSGYSSTDPLYTQIVEKLRTNLYQYFAEDEQLLSRLDTTSDFLVNAKLALKGKLEGKQPLVEASQLPALEKAVRRLFRDTDSAQVAVTLSHQVIDLLQQGIDAAQQQGSHSELQKLEQLLSLISESQVSLSTKLNNHANRAKPALKSELATLLSNNQPDQVKPVIEQWQQQQTSYFTQQLEREISRLDVEADAVVQAVFNINTSASDGLNEQDQGAGKGAGISTLFKALTSQGFKFEITNEVAQKGVIEALKQGKKWLPTLFKGIGPKTMEKMAGRVIPFVGPFIDLTMSGVDYYKAKQQEERQMHAERQRLEKINNYSQQFVEECYEQWFAYVEDALDEVYLPLIAQMQAYVKELSKQVGGVEADVFVLKQAQQRLQRFG